MKIYLTFEGFIVKHKATLEKLFSEFLKETPDYEGSFFCFARGIFAETEHFKAAQHFEA